MNRIGLVMACVLGSPAVLVHRADDGSSPAPFPDWFAVANAALDVVTFVAALWTWRTSSRAGARLVAASRILSLLIAVPALLAVGAPDRFVERMAVQTAATALIVALVLARGRRDGSERSPHEASPAENIAP
nr:hypothetical protein [Streptomyces sp. TLI_235]